MMQKKLQTARGTVYYWTNERIHAGADTLVFLHGLTADHRLFEQQLAYFSRDYHVIAWDAPAHGLSRPYAAFSYANAAEDLKQLLDENGIPFAVLIGQSMGGWIAQSFLCRYPAMGKAFIGIDTCPYGSGYYSQSDQWWLRQIEWMSRCYPVRLLKAGIAAQTAATGYARQSMMEMLEGYGKEELCRLLGAGYREFLKENREAALSCPVLILAGEWDRTGKILQYCARWAARTGYPYKIIRRAAHNANADNPAEVNRAIREFLEGL